MQGVDLGPALALRLLPDPDRQGEQRAEALLEPRIAVDLAAYIPDHSAEPGAQKPQLAIGALELMRVEIAADPDQSVLGHPPIALTQPDPTPPGEFHQLD